MRQSCTQDGSHLGPHKRHMHRDLNLHLRLCGLIFAALPIQAIAAEPWVPGNDEVVVEHVRSRPVSQDELLWREWRTQLRQQSDNVALAIRVAQKAMQWAREEGDPRWLGQAQAALNPWWAQEIPPAEIRLMRAILLQSTHEFDPALRDLTALGNNADMAIQSQALLTKTSVLQVTGQYEAAQQSCTALKSTPLVWYAQACQLELKSLQGQAAMAQKQLQALTTQAPADTLSYLQLIQAELAERLGQEKLASLLYQELLLTAPDVYIEAAYADFLLDQGDARQVIARLTGHEKNDALLLRLAQAHAQINSKDTDALIRQLASRFAAAHARGDAVHLREEARFVLHLQKKPQQALALALRNWRVQKEPIDARLVLEAAVASGQQEAATPVRQFIAQHRLEDKRLEKLL